MGSVVVRTQLVTALRHMLLMRHMAIPKLTVTRHCTIAQHLAKTAALRAETWLGKRLVFASKRAHVKFSRIWAQKEAPMASKRKCPSNGGMHVAIEAAVRKIQHPATAVAMVEKIDVRYTIGVAAKPGSMNAFVERAKEDFADAIILLRVGDFYEAFGVDAIIVVATAGTSPVKNELKTSFRFEKVQDVCNKLVHGGHRAAIYEETAVMITPRQRIFAQLVCSAMPTYKHAPCDCPSIDDAPCAKPIVAIRTRVDSLFDVMVVRANESCYQLHDGVHKSIAEALVATAAEPVLCIRTVPAFVYNFFSTSPVILGASAEASMENRVLRDIKQTLRCSTDEFRKIPVVQDACGPLTQFTVQNLGMGTSQDTPSLTASCVTKRACAAVRDQMIAWLKSPPGMCHELQAVGRALCTSLNRLPAMQPLRHVKWSGSLQVTSLEMVHALFVNTQAVLDLCEVDCFSKLFKRIAASYGFEESTYNIQGLLGTLTAFVTFKGEWRSELTEHCHAALAMALEQQAEFRSTLVKESFTVQGTSTVMFGKPNNVDKLSFRDTNRRIAQDRHVTRQSVHWDSAVETAQDNVAELQSRLLKSVQEAMLPYQIEGITVHAFVVAVATMTEHVRAVGNLWCWPCVSTDGRLKVQSMYPYWMHDGVRSDLDVLSGTPIVLTGPNGGGKSTILRSLAAVSLLSQIGLMVPAAQASVPNFAHVFLRTGAADCAAERRSSFANEMADLTTMMTAAAPALILIDEPCRGTSTADGKLLFKAILEHLSGCNMSVFATHYHDLDAKGVEYMQMQAHVDGASCVPMYKLAHGHCRQSLALHCALAAGLPVEIVQAACQPDDEETALMASLYKIGLSKFHKMDANDTPPASLRSVLYALITDDGIYIGETDDFYQRLTVHRATKNPHTVFFCPMRDKSHAKSCETRLQRELQFANVRLLSITDAAHSIAIL